MFSTGPFSNHLRSPEIKIVQHKGSVVVFDKRHEQWIQTASFQIGKEFFWSDNDRAEYRADPGRASATILPGNTKDQIEGWIHVKDGGDLEVEKVYWEGGLVLFLIPFYEDSRSRFYFEKAKDE